MNKLRIILLLLSLSAARLPGQDTGRTASGEMVLRAFRKCFPEKTGAVSFIDNDWTITAGGVTFYWAGGRLLPEAEKGNADSYGPHFFYVIPDKATPPEDFPPRYVEALRERAGGEARLDRKDSNRAFYGALYGGLERKEIEARLERVDFLGKKVTLHQDIAGALKRIETEIKKWDGAENFIATLGSVESYSWRQIAGTRRLSYHSWGLAVDIQPKSLGGKAIYWLWERERNKDWMLVPLDKRWNPPGPVIEAFEKEGFIWGGKWPLYDNMHFEYHPELFELTRLLAANPAAGAETPGRDLHHIYPEMSLRAAGR